MAALAAVARYRICGFLPGSSEFCSLPRTFAFVSTSHQHVKKHLVFSAQLSVEAPRNSAGGRDGKNGDQGCFNSAVAMLAKAPVLPKLLVVDLDYTVWPSYCQYKTLTSTPTVYPQAVDIIRALAASKVALAVASRTPALAVALYFMKSLSIFEHFSYLEIYFTIYSKTKHFTALKEQSGVAYSSMLFFDDEAKNINTACKLGVKGVLVTEGLDLKSLEKGLGLLATRD